MEEGPQCARASYFFPNIAAHARIGRRTSHDRTAITMLRRQARERREYIYRKSLEQQEQMLFERKQKVRQLLAAGKPIPKELLQGHGGATDAANAAELRKLARDVPLDEAQADPSTSVDDEYSSAGQYDPKILVTTSRDPSSRLSQFSKEIRLAIPNSTRLNRGGYTMKELAAACRANAMTDLVVLHEHRGVPDALVVSHFPHGPTVLFTLQNVTLRHEVQAHASSTISEQYPHLILEGFNSRLGARISNVLKHLFPVPKEDAKRVMTFANDRDFISFR